MEIPRITYVYTRLLTELAAARCSSVGPVYANLVTLAIRKVMSISSRTVHQSNVRNATRSDRRFCWWWMGDREGMRRPLRPSRHGESLENESKFSACEHALRIQNVVAVRNTWAQHASFVFLIYLAFQMKNIFRTFAWTRPETISSDVIRRTVRKNKKKFTLQLFFCTTRKWSKTKPFWSALTYNILIN